MRNVRASISAGGGVSYCVPFQRPEGNFAVVERREVRQPPEKIEFAVFQLLAPVAREFPDQPPFAREDFGADDADVFRPQAELARPP